MIESSGALVVKDVRTGDEGDYSCRAENLLGSVHATAKLTVQCKLYNFTIKIFRALTYFCFEPIIQLELA